MDMNTAAWEDNSLEREELHRESRQNEFFGWCLGQMKEHRRLFPGEQPANGVLNAASALMTCGLNETLQTIDTACMIHEFVQEWGWPAAIQILGSAMRELEWERR